jgi:fatty acid desaturase
LAFGYVLTAFLFFSAGLLSLGTLRHMYLLVVAMALLNSLRTLVAHRYRNRTEKEISFTEQFLDSVNIEGNPVLMEILAPVGLRYHALHHVFANMPYHNLGIAHRRLKKQLPADSIYHISTEPSFMSAMRTHWKNTREAHQEEEKMARSSTRA